MNSLNYISTGTWTRPEPNGLSHQNPSFIGSVLNLKSTIGRVYLRPDANTFLSTLAHCLRSKNYINLIVSSRNPGPTWLSPGEADIHCRAGGSIRKRESGEGCIAARELDVNVLVGSAPLGFLTIKWWCVRRPYNSIADVLAAGNSASRKSASEDRYSCEDHWT